MARRHAVRGQPLRRPLCREAAARSCRWKSGTTARSGFWCAPASSSPELVQRPLKAVQSHGRYPYSAITRRPDYQLARQQASRGLPRLQPRALRFRRRPGRRARPEKPRARRAQLLLARLRQPRRRVALPRAVRRAQAAASACSSTPRSTTTAPNSSRRASSAATSSSATATPTPSARASLPKTTKRALLERLPRPHRARESASAPARLARPVDFAKACHARSAGTRPATATRSTGATTTSRSNSATRGGRRSGRSPTRRS